MPAYDIYSYFSGSLNNVNLADLYLKSEDYKIHTLKERLALIERKMSDGFLENYFDNYFKVKLNSGNNLSAENNVCRLIESYANYLLNSEELKQERKTTLEYRFYRNEKEFKLRTSKEVSMEDDPNIIHFLCSAKKNDYILEDYKITKFDLDRDDFLGSVLREYNKLIEILNGSVREKDKREIGRIKDDMILTKLAYTKPIDWGNHKSSFFPNTYDCFDWKNPNHVKELLTVKRDLNPECNLSHLVLSLDNYIKEMKKKKMFKLKQIKILDMYINGFNQSEISKEVGIKQPSVSKQINKLAEKISNYAEN